MRLFGKCGLSDNFFVIHSNLYYKHLVVLDLFVNFAFYQHQVQLMFVNLLELNQKEYSTGTTVKCQNGLHLSP